MTAVVPTRAARRAPWSDARFFLGILLIAASVAGVWFVVSAARQTAPVFAASHTIVPGETVTARISRSSTSPSAGCGDAYFHPDALVDGLVATRTITAGQLVPADAVGEAARARTTSVVVRSAVDVPASVEAGTVVEVWAAPMLDDEGDYDVPRILVADATVVSVTRDDSMIGGGSAALELVIPRADVAATLAAMAGESALSVVPTAGAAQ